MQTKKSQTVQNNVKKFLSLFNKNVYTINNSYSQAWKFKNLQHFRKTLNDLGQKPKIKFMLLFYKNLQLTLCCC